MNNNNCLIRFAALLVLLLLALPLRAQVITLTGANLGGLQGLPVQTLSFFSVQSGQLRPVAHQWVQWSEQDVPYFSQDSNTLPAGSADRVDASDRLLLRFSDGGQPLKEPSSESVVAELSVSRGGEQRYFYAVRNAYLQHNGQHVQFSNDPMSVKSTDYALFMADQNLLRWHDFYYRGFQGPTGGRHSILDSLKLRLSAGLLGGNRVTLTNDNLDPRIEEIISGPLATLIYASTSVRVAKVPVLRIHNYVLFMPRQVEIHSRFTLPRIAGTVLQSPGLDISMDGNQLYGSQLQTSWTGNLTAHTDGALSDDEKAMLKQPMGEDNWLWFSTGRGFDLLAQLDFVEGFDVPVQLLYQDDANLENAPERFPGQLPNVGFSMRDIPFGQSFYFITRLFFDSDSQGLTASQYAERRLESASVTVEMR